MANTTGLARRAVLRGAALGALGSLGAAWIARPARAQSAWPERPVRIVVPYAPGGSADTLGRLVALQLQNTLRQPFVTDNRAGAGGTVGSQQVSKAAPDGYTLVVSGIGSHVIAPVESKAYNPVTDFTHIAMLGGPPTALAVHPSVPASNLRELIAHLQREKDVSWGSSGQGTHAHLLGELFWRTAGIAHTHIPYKGGSPAIADLVGGQIPAAFTTFTSANAQIQAGRLKCLAITAESRLPDYPSLPTFAEQGYGRLTAMTWFSLSGPPGMPAAIVDRLNAEVRRALRTEAARKVLVQEAIETRDWDPATFTNYVRSEVERWQPLVASLRR
ncbi:MAG TPA: tripartite tricarboxylate transporter substrate binding protein [Ramlibacter sp.]|nr:tripartite tricarboxylate transporter substrate binding protein [Ramlibacter sp.]